MPGPTNGAGSPAKLFEYLAVRRPILGLGPLDGVPARLVGQRRAGLFANDPDEIAGQLRLWVEQKRDHGRLPELHESVCEGLTRDAQYAVLEAFLAATVQRCGNLQPARRSHPPHGIPADTRPRVAH